MFKTELNKVFLTVLATYFIAACYSSWMQSLIEWSKKERTKNQKYE